MSIEVSNRRGYNFYIELPTKGEFEWKMEKDIFKAIFLQKWTWLCFSMDYEKKKVELAINGKILELSFSGKLNARVLLAQIAD